MTFTGEKFRTVRAFRTVRSSINLVWFSKSALKQKSIPLLLDGNVLLYLEVWQKA